MKLPIERKKKEVTKEKVTVKAAFIDLTPDGKRLYAFICSELKKEGIYKLLDYLLVTQLVKNLLLWKSVATLLNGPDDCVTYYGGTKGSNVNGNFVMFNKTMTNCIQLYEKLGIGPTVQNKVVNFVNNQLEINFEHDAHYSLARPVIVVGDGEDTDTI